MTAAVARLLTDDDLRTRIIHGGLNFARVNTIEAQSDVITDAIRSRLLDIKASRITPTTPGAPCPPAPSPKGRGSLGQGRLRVDIPLAGLNVSGGVKSLLYLANALARRGHRVRCIVPDYASVSPVPLESGVELRVLRSGPGPSVTRKAGYFARLGVQSATDCDICLANYFLTSYPAVASNLMNGGRALLVYNIRGYEPISHGSLAEAGGIGRSLRAGLASLSYHLPLQKVVTTDWLKEMVGDERSIVIGHGIDPGVFHSRGRDPSTGTQTVRVGVIGRSGEVKGYSDFLEALTRTRSDLPIRILIAGQDEVAMPEGQPFERMHTPTEREMAEFFRACDVFVFPSRAEGFGLPPSKPWPAAQRAFLPTAVGCGLMLAPMRIASLSTCRIRKHWQMPWIVS